jgi:hypothetical protein
VFSPSQLAAAVRKSDKSAGKGAFAKGDALMQDLSDRAQSVMGSNVGNSGTADRALAAYVASNALNPLAWPKLLGQGAGAGLLTIPYMPGVRQGINWALAGRQGPGAKAASDALLTLSPALGAALAPSGYGLLQ